MRHLPAKTLPANDGHQHECYLLKSPYAGETNVSLGTCFGCGMMVVLQWWECLFCSFKRCKNCGNSPKLNGPEAQILAEFRDGYMPATSHAANYPRGWIPPQRRAP